MSVLGAYCKRPVKAACACAREVGTMTGVDEESSDDHGYYKARQDLEVEQQGPVAYILAVAADEGGLNAIVAVGHLAVSICVLALAGDLAMAKY